MEITGSVVNDASTLLAGGNLVHRGESSHNLERIYWEEEKRRVTKKFLGIFKRKRTEIFFVKKRWAAAQTGVGGEDGSEPLRRA